MSLTHYHFFRVDFSDGFPYDPRERLEEGSSVTPHRGEDCTYCLFSALVSRLVSGLRRKRLPSIYIAVCHSPTILTWINIRRDRARALPPTRKCGVHEKKADNAHLPHLLLRCCGWRAAFHENSGVAYTFLEKQTDAALVMHFFLSFPRLQQCFVSGFWKCRAGGKFVHDRADVKLPPPILRNYLLEHLCELLSIFSLCNYTIIWSLQEMTSLF